MDALRPALDWVFYSKIWRLTVAVKHFIDTGAGVVDEDYRGPLKVLLFNHSDTDFNGVHFLVTMANI
jgi:dUTPase